MVTKKAIDRLPSLPQVLVRILDAIHCDNADFQKIAHIIKHDIAIATKLVAVANSSFYGTANCESIERALLFLGTDTVKTIVITTSIKHYFSRFNLQHHQFLNSFWRRSLVAANFAQVLATLTRYEAPDEAYLCGLLADVGQLMLLTENNHSYLPLVESAENAEQLLAAERDRYATDHCQLASELVDSWQMKGFMSDAVRYHHEPANEVLDAHHLVKIINLANMLGDGEHISELMLEAAYTLFGLNESLTRELCSRINDDVNNLAHSLGINIDDSNLDNEHQTAHRKLGERLGELTELAQLNTNLWQAQNEKELQTAIERALFLTLNVSKYVIFFYDADGNLLSSRWDADNANKTPTFSIPAVSSRSVISESFVKRKRNFCVSTNQELTVIDKQLLRYCHADALLCWPLHDLQSQQMVGVLVIGTTNEQQEKLEQRTVLCTALFQEIASVITTCLASNNDSVITTHYQHKIKEAVHEASNPLSIIRNYLETLRLTLGKEHSANEGLELIKEEIDRVGNILLRLNDTDQKTEESSLININKTIESIEKIFSQSICSTKNIHLKLKLDAAMPSVPGKSNHLKQILTNLFKNAIEAITEDGEIIVRSESCVSVSGRDFAAIIIEDNGPGIPEKIKQLLFNPVTSTKNNHTGLGLSIVKKLVDDMKGTIVCRSNPGSGTQFQILLPK